MSLATAATRSMRAECNATMEALAERHESMFALGADGFSIFERFAKRRPDRFVDVGISETNLVGVAAGLARAGHKVVVSCIGAFLVRRAQEQIRNDVCNPGLDVTFVGVGAGFSYGWLGATHHMIEDLAVMRTMPSAAVFSPVDAAEAAAALEAAVALDGPAWLRIGAREDPVLHREPPSFEVGTPVLLRRSRSPVLVVATGICVSHALSAADDLAEQGVDVSVANVHTLRPETGALSDLVRRYEVVVTVEEHSHAGGLGDLVARLLQGSPGKVVARLGVAAAYPPVGDRDELLRHFRVDREAIRDEVLLAIGGVPG